MREVYLDNAATTKVRPEIAEAMAKAMVENYGNPSSIYKAAQRAATAIAAARQQVADLIGASPKEIIFTGGGSEGDNMLIKGVVHANVKKDGTLSLRRSSITLYCIPVKNWRRKALRSLTCR